MALFYDFFAPTFWLHCILYFTYGGGFAPHIGTVQKCNVARKLAKRNGAIKQCHGFLHELEMSWIGNELNWTNVIFWSFTELEMSALYFTILYVHVLLSPFCRYPSKDSVLTEFLCQCPSTLWCQVLLNSNVNLLSFGIRSFEHIWILSLFQTATWPQTCAKMDLSDCISVQWASILQTRYFGGTNVSYFLFQFPLQ